MTASSPAPWFSAGQGLRQLAGHCPRPLRQGRGQEALPDLVFELRGIRNLKAAVRPLNDVDLQVYVAHPVGVEFRRGVYVALLDRRVRLV